MNIPAVIICHPDCSPFRLAGLPVIDRLIVAAHRAGAENIIVVSEKALPPLKRTGALGIAFTSTAVRPELTGPTLVLSDRLLVQAADLKCLIARRGRLVSRDGTPLPAGVLAELSGRPLEDQFSTLPAVPAEGVAEPITDAASADVAARKLWASLSSSADGLVDKHFNRPVGRWLSKILVHTPVSPNQVSLAATVLGLISAWFFAQGDYWFALSGAILLQISAIVDCVDGDLARVLADIRSLVAGGSDRSQLDFRLRQADGSQIWFAGESTVLRDGSRKVIGIEGILTDITERRGA